MIYKENHSCEKGNTNIFKKLIKSLVLWMTMCVVFVLIISFFVTYTDLSEALIDPAVNIVRLVAILLCSLTFAMGGKTRGWLKGVISGGMFCLLLYISGVIFIHNYTDIVNPIKLFSEGIIVGMTGGIIGINLKRQN